ncbi:MAG: anaerobic ribonucleoside-triphosphate reductase activating protein [Fusobacteriaceae bacterium]
MNYSGIKYADMINGRGIRVSLFVSGCIHKCNGCFNKDTWNPHFGKPFSEDTEEEILNYFEKYRSSLSGISLLGGDPTYHDNLEPLTNFIKKFKTIFSEKDIWIWSGYKWEEIVANNNILELVSQCNILIDGKFDIKEKNPNLKWKGSNNQRVIDVQKTIKNGIITEID